MRLHLLRTAAAVAAGVVLAISVTGQAGAATPGPDLAAASAAAHSSDAGKLIDKAAARFSKSSSKAGTVVQQDAVPVYALNPEFVNGKSGEVATLWYVATSATKAGTQLTVYTAPEESTGSWQPVNVATGNTESRMAALTRGAQLFTEPQIGAWYALTGDRIRPLNPSATDSIGPNPITIEAYRQLVTTRYADKQPGSPYSENGTAGGYDVSTAIPAKSSSSFAWLAGGAATIALAAAALILHRRTRTTA